MIKYNGIVVLILFFCIGIVANGQLLVKNPKTVNKVSLFQDDEEYDDESGIHISLNMGMYFPGKSPARFYAGDCAFEVDQADANGVRCYSIPERLGLQGGVFENTTYNQVVNDLQQQFPGVTGFRTAPDMYPENMRYRGAFMYGLNLTFALDNYSAVVLNSNFARVKAVDAFALILEGLSPQPNAPEAIELFTVWAEESRFNVQLGWKQEWEINDKTTWVFELGANMLGLRLDEHKIDIGGRSYDLIIGADNPSQLINYQPITNITFGGYVTPGLEFTFENGLSAMLGYSIMRDRFKMETVDMIQWNSMVFARFSF